MFAFIIDNLFAIVAIWLFLFIGFTGFFRNPKPSSEQGSETDHGVQIGEIFSRQHHHS